MSILPGDQYDQLASNCYWINQIRKILDEKIEVDELDERTGISGSMRLKGIAEMDAVLVHIAAIWGHNENTNQL